MIKWATEFWGENHFQHPPLTPEMLSEAEASLGVRLPKPLIMLLELQNGGCTKGFRFLTMERTSWAEDHVPLDDLGGIVLEPSKRSAFNIMDSAYMIEEWGLPERQVLLTGDGHWWISLDYRAGDEPKVIWIDKEADAGHQELKLANSFDEFLSGLVRNSDYADA